MEKKIEFPPGEQELFERDAIVFPAKVAGEYVKCIISDEALMQWCQATKGHTIDVFKLNRYTIESVAVRLINAGKVQNGELIITARDFGTR